DGNAFTVGEEGTIAIKTGQAAQPVGELSTPVVNNAIRRVLRPALARMRLQAKDPDVRLAAAVEVSKRPSEDLLEPMRSALAAESEDDISTLLRLGIAQMDLESPQRERRLAALAVLKEDGDVSHKATLQSLLGQDAEGNFSESDEGI